MFLRVPTPQPPIEAEAIFSFGNLYVTNAMLLGVVLTFFLLLFFVMLKRRISLVPSGLQATVEMLVGAFITLLEQITGDREKAEKLLPLVGTIFIFFGLSNFIGLIPGLTSITYDGVALFRTPTNDFNMTFSVALAIVVLTQIMSIRTFGLFGHLGKFFKFKGIYLGFKKSAGDGALAIVDFLIGLLDIVGELAKVVSLSLRLFGNMYAGEVLAAILLGAFAAVVPAPWMAMNMLVAVLQAMVFGSLTAAYYTLAVESSEPEAV